MGQINLIKSIKSVVFKTSNILYQFSSADDAYQHIEQLLLASEIFSKVSLLPLESDLEKHTIHSLLYDKLSKNSDNLFLQKDIADIKGLESFEYIYSVNHLNRNIMLICYNLKDQQSNKDELFELLELISLQIKHISSHFKDTNSQIELEREMDLLHEILASVSEKKALGTLLADIMAGSKKLMSADASSLLLYDEEEKTLHFQVAQGSKGKLIKQYSVELGAGIAGYVGKHKKPLLIEDCYKDSRFNSDFDKKTGYRTKSMICVPLLKKKKLVGVMQVINKLNDNPFTERDLKLFESLASQVAISIENAKLSELEIQTEATERDLAMAKSIQEKLLPERLPKYSDLDVAATLVPAKAVGGDYYNIIPMNDEYSLFFVADVTGKGVPAALIVSSIYSCIFTYLMNVKFDMLALCDRMNKLLIQSTTYDKFASCWFGLYEHKTKKLTSINAGHNPPYLIKRNTNVCRTLNVGGIFLGSIDFIPYEKEDIQLDSGDTIVFFTDGVTEAWNKNEEDYGEMRLEKKIIEHINDDATTLLRSILKDVNHHVNGAQQSDDITLAIVKIK